MNELTNQEWYETLVGECKAIVTEAVFTSRWALVEGYWHLGEHIRNNENLKKWEQNKAGRVLQDLAKDVNLSTRTLHYALQTYDKFPEIDKIPEGKNITWNKLTTKYLPELKENKIEIPIPKGQFQTIVIDPPWEIEKINREVRPNQIEMDYPTLSLDKLGKIVLPSAENSHLYLWTTHKHLPDALQLVETWGFKYQCLLTWVKNVGITPFSWMYSTEHVLFCTKGNLPLLKLGKRLDFQAKVREHSRKPDEFYDLVKEVSPGPRLDMFAREPHDGFETWGNEVTKFDAIQ